MKNIEKNNADLQDTLLRKTKEHTEVLGWDWGIQKPECFPKLTTKDFDGLPEPSWTGCDLSLFIKKGWFQDITGRLPSNTNKNH